MRVLVPNVLWKSNRQWGTGSSSWAILTHKSQSARYLSIMGCQRPWWNNLPLSLRLSEFPFYLPYTDCVAEDLHTPRMLTAWQGFDGLLQVYLGEWSGKLMERSWHSHIGWTYHKGNLINTLWSFSHTQQWRALCLRISINYRNNDFQNYIYSTADICGKPGNPLKAIACGTVVAENALEKYPKILICF